MHTDYEDVLELPDGKELTPENLFVHARDVIEDRWPEAEPIIMESSFYASQYAWLVINGRWPKAEPIIMQDPYSAWSYAVNVIKGRWPEAEPIIMEDPWTANYYACEVIKDRWPEAEPIIMKKQDAWRGYCKHFGIS